MRWTSNGGRWCPGSCSGAALRIHQIRYGVDLLPYDLAWNGAAVVLLGIGLLVLHRARRWPAPVASPGGCAGPRWAC
ncbi:DUF2243 domain-containing protein [Kineococcus auxinigenes]|uniref:DUF2243 domain-containing protein n=1 Tax=unclassified Kineococcus TaxID=2621656 RepID=UPI003D7D3B76